MSRWPDFYPELKLAYAVCGNKLERGLRISEQTVIGILGTTLDWCTKLKFIDPQDQGVYSGRGQCEGQSIHIQKMLLFSAPFEGSVWNFAQKVVSDPNVIRLKREEMLDTIKQLLHPVQQQRQEVPILYNM